MKGVQSLLSATNEYVNNKTGMCVNTLVISITVKEREVISITVKGRERVLCENNNNII